MTLALAATLRRFVSHTVKAAVLLVVIVTLTALGGRATGPPTAVLGEVEFNPDAAIVVTVPTVQILDALCITKVTTTPDPC